DQAGPAEGPVVVAAHGLTSSRASEDASGLTDWSALPAAGFRLVRYDARGHGRSTGSLDPGAYRWQRLADDLLAVIDAVAGEGPVDVVGSSMGVGTALWAALRAPERFRRLVLVIPPTAWATRAAQTEIYETGARFIEERGLDAFVRGSAALPPLPILAAAGLWPLPGPDVTETLLPTIFRGAAATDLPAAEELTALPHEALLLPWADDPGHPVSTAERLLEVLPNATMHVARTPDHLRARGRLIAEFLAA
ncbi:MAG: alpha/beta fold hydrolase, partial [Amnibacterium sp.]